MSDDPLGEGLYRGGCLQIRRSEDKELLRGGSRSSRDLVSGLSRLWQLPRLLTRLLLGQDGRLLSREGCLLSLGLTLGKTDVLEDLQVA